MGEAFLIVYASVAYMTIPFLGEPDEPLWFVLLQAIFWPIVWPLMLILKL